MDEQTEPAPPDAAMPQSRIIRALAHWRKTVGDTGTVFMLPPDAPDEVALRLQRVLFAAGSMADAIERELPALLALVDAAYTVTQYFQMRGRTDEQDHVRIALDAALRALGLDPDAHPPDHERIDRALERGRKALEEGS